MKEGNIFIICGGILLITAVFFSLVMINEGKVIKNVPCYDRNDNLIIGVTCIEERYSYIFEFTLSFIVGVMFLFMGVLAKSLEDY